MSIDDDAVHVLVSLAQYGKTADDPERGRYAFEGEELTTLTKLSPNRLNDAVALLGDNGYVEIVKYMGTHPYDFGEASLTPHGRREAETAVRVIADRKAAATSTLVAVDDARFSFGAMLGEGTFGEVWRASDLELKREVAVKFVLAAGEQDALAHARALARVVHPNIVAVHDITILTNPTNGAASQAVVMELVDGTPLVELIGPAMNRPDVERVGLGLIGALGAYHAAGLAHLDVHDGNVMVTKDAVKVLDPLYYETAWFRSTATRDKQQARDVRQARDVLQQMLHAGSVEAIAANSFDQATLRPTLDVLKVELERALGDQPVPSPKIVGGVSGLPIANVSSAAAEDSARVRELRVAYSAWFVAARTWLDSIFGFGMRLEASGDPVRSHDGVDPEDRRRLEAATLQVIFLDGHSSRNARVEALVAVIGMGDRPKPSSPREHREFGMRCITVCAERLKELDIFQRSVAEWLTSYSATNS